MSVLLIVFLFAAWAGLHTTLASLRTKRLARRLFGESARQWYRMAFVLVAALTLVPVVMVMLRLPDRILYAVPAPWRWLMIAGQVCGFAGLVWTIRATDASDFIGLHLLRGRERGFTAELVTRGLYRWVRHPMYTTGLMIMWLMPVMSRTLLVLFGCMSVYFLVGSMHEESLLVRQFGSRYEEYQRRVPRLIPGAGRWRSGPRFRKQGPS